MLKTQGLQSLEQIRAFVEGAQALGFEVPAREAAYDWIAGELRRLGYTRLGKTDKGLVRRGPSAVPFARRYMPGDIRLLAERGRRPARHPLGAGHPQAV